MNTVNIPPLSGLCVFCAGLTNQLQCNFFIKNSKQTTQLSTLGGTILKLKVKSVTQSICTFTVNRQRPTSGECTRRIALDPENSLGPQTSTQIHRCDLQNGLLLSGTMSFELTAHQVFALSVVQGCHLQNFSHNTIVSATLFEKYQEHAQWKAYRWHLPAIGQRWQGSKSPWHCAHHVPKTHNAQTHQL